MGVSAGLGSGGVGLAVVAGILAGVGLLCGFLALIVVNSDPKQVGGWTALLGMVLSCPPLGVAWLIYQLATTPVPSKGRPLRQGHTEVLAPAEDSSGWQEVLAVRPRSVDPQLSGLLAELWIKDGLAEHASVASFASLSLRLLAVGAPAQLVEKTHRAALDEIAHARESFALATAYAGALRGPGAMPLPKALLVPTASDANAELVKLAEESVDDGVLGELYAASVAARGAATARDPAVAKVLARIAEDERRHAEIAWDIILFCLSRAPQVVGPAVAARRDRLRSWSAVSERLSEPDGLDEHGRVAYAQRRELFAVARRQAVARLGRTLAARA